MKTVSKRRRTKVELIFFGGTAGIILSMLGGYIIAKQNFVFGNEIVLVWQLLSIGLVNFAIITRFIKPMGVLKERLNVLDAGDFSVRFNESGQGFYAEVGAAFNRLLDKINNASAFVKSIEDGALEAHYEGDNVGNDQLSSALLSMRDQMKRIDGETAERNWVTQGMAQFVEILRANDENIEALSNKIIGNLVKYLNANQGGLFMLNDEEGETYLELTACYAFDRKKFVEKRVEKGQGLIGQTFLEKETIYITDVPQDYITITSGLGDARPSSIILVPLKINEEVYGVIEMASFHTFEKYQIDFLEKLGESIASTIATTKNTEKTKVLLMESQQQTEEMRAQEEEMRQNMEELEATQEEMRRVSTELEEQQDKLTIALRLANMANWEIDVESNMATFNENYYQLFNTDVHTEGSYKVRADHMAMKYYHKQAHAFQAAAQKVIEQADHNYEEHIVHAASTKDGKELWLDVVIRAEVHNGTAKSLFGITRDVTREKTLEIETTDQLDQMKAQEEVMVQNMEEMHMLQDRLTVLEATIQEKEHALKTAQAALEQLKGGKNKVTASV